MKRFFCTLGIGVAAWTFGGVRNLNAADIQSRNIAVPFAFKVDRTTLPAGHYRVEQNIGKQVAFIVNVQTGHRIQIMRDNINDPTGNAKLTFERTRDGYKLSRIS